MRRWNRALTTLVAAAAAGCLLWFVPHFDRWSSGGYWGVMGLTALAGLLLGFSQLHGRDGNPLASFLFAFLPVLVAAGWVILAAQPNDSWIRDHVLEWSGDLGIAHAVHNLGEHVAVLAFGLGIIFGLIYEPGMARRGRVEAEVAPAEASSTPPVADESLEPAPEEPVARQVETDEREPVPPPP